MITNESITSIQEEPIISLISSEEKTIQRIATLDFFRGIAIFFMVIFHVIMKVYDYYWIEDFNNLIQLPIPILILMGIGAFFGTWHGFFLFISSIVNAYVVIRKVEKVAQIIPTLLKQVVTGFVLIFLGWFELAFGYNGYFGELIRGGSWKDFSLLYESFFVTDTLQIIGICLIINGLLLFILSQKEGYRKYWRNMLIYIALAITTLAITALFRKWIPTFSWLFQEGNNTMFELLDAATIEGSFFAWLLSSLFGGLLSPFPFMVSSFVGTMIGLTLRKPDLSSKTPLIGALIGFITMTFGVVLIVFGAPWTTIENFTALSTYFLKLGGQITLVWLLLYFVEFKEKGAKFGNNSLVKFFRTWGIISLTIYIMQIFEYFPRLLLHLMFSSVAGVNFLQNGIYGRGEELGVIFITIFTLLWFYLLILVWSKIDFIGSFEWCIMKIQSFFFKTKIKRLNAEMLLNSVQWINFMPIAQTIPEKASLTKTPIKRI